MKTRLLLVLGFCLFLVGACRLVPAAAPTATPSQSTPTPLLTRALPPTTTPTEVPTRTATPQPEWVTGFTRPILDAISVRPPDFQDDFSTRNGGWAKDWCPHGSLEIRDGELVATSCRFYRPNIDWPDFAMEFDLRFLERTTPGSYFVVAVGDQSGPGNPEVAQLRVDFEGIVTVTFRGPDGDESVEITRAAPGSQPYHILLIFQGTRFAVIFNGQPEYYVEIESYRFGRELFLVEPGQSANPGETALAIVAIDNFKIWDVSDIQVP
jgi:hypothetical protein